MEELIQALKDFPIIRFIDYEFTALNLVYLVSSIVGAFVLFWIYKALSRRFFRKFSIKEIDQTPINRFFTTLLYWSTGILIVRSAGLPLARMLNYKLWSTGIFEFRLEILINGILVYVLARTITWVLIRVMDGYYQANNIDRGTQYAIDQMIKYIIYTLMVLSILQIVFGDKMTVIWGGAAALLVGFGLGMQQTFNDLISGILLMLEGSVSVGDTIEVDGFVGTVTKIGIRASQIRTRDNIAIIVPNSHMVMEGVVNWSHIDKKKRFKIDVGVAYGSNVKKVKQLLLTVAARHEKVLDEPPSFVRFTNFGASSLDFQLHFWTFELRGIDDVKSDLRFAIEEIFNENDVEMPFPQQDIWFRNAPPQASRQ